MADKDADSMVVKPIDYAASEFSATSEAPPAYKLRQANSVKIAKIVSFTIILSTFILGSFIIASTYLQAKASCDQVSALDAILNKELMLETMQQDLPRPEALLSNEKNENDLQDLSKDEMNKPNKNDETNPDDIENINTEKIIEENDYNSIDGEMKRVHIKMPLDVHLSELAHNIMMNNQKSRMNCMVERRRTEEVEEPKQVNPFSIFMNEPKKEKVTGERISIFCETGTPKNDAEPLVQVHRIMMPSFENSMPRFGPQIPLQFQQGPQFQQGSQFQQGPQFQQAPMNMMNQPLPLINMPPRIPQFIPQQQINIPPNQMNFQTPPVPMSLRPQNLQFPMQFPPIPAEQMSPPRPEVPQFRLINPAPEQSQMQNLNRPQSQQLDQLPQPEVRIHLRRIQIPGPISDVFPFLNNIQNEYAKEIETPRQNVQIQQMPLAIALSKVGITPDDLKNIQRMAEEKFQEHIRELVADEDNDSNSDSDSVQSGEEVNGEMITATPQMQDSNEEMEKNQSSQELNDDSSQKEKSVEVQPQILALGRSNFGRSLNPVQLPGRMEGAEIQEAEQSDYVHPR